MKDFIPNGQIEKCFELTKKYYANLGDSILSSMYSAEALVIAREIAQKNFPGCSDTRGYTVFFIFSAAAELGKSLDELNAILKEYGML